MFTAWEEHGKQHGKQHGKHWRLYTMAFASGRNDSQCFITCKKKNEWMNGWMEECINEWTKGLMNEWMDEWMNGWMD